MAAAQCLRPARVGYSCSWWRCAPAVFLLLVLAGGVGARSHSPEYTAPSQRGRSQLAGKVSPALWRRSHGLLCDPSSAGRFKPLEGAFHPFGPHLCAAFACKHTKAVVCLTHAKPLLLRNGLMQEKVFEATDGLL